MLFRIEYIDTNMIYLNEVLGHFIQKAIGLSQYRKNSLYPPEFLVVHDDARNNIDIKFKAVFEQIKSLQPDQKKRLARMYVNHQRIKRLCDGNAKIIGFSGLPIALKKSLKDLGDYLYDSALKNSKIKQLAKQKHGNKNGSLRELWKAYEKKNGVVCCFCGIQECEEQPPETSKLKWRPAFDHYLPKEHYPLAAVNFNNLIPSCAGCNSKSKGSKDILNCLGGLRNIAIFPYNNVDVLGLKFSFVKETLSWEIELKKNDDMHRTWNKIYNIKERVKARIDANYKNWLIDDCKDCFNVDTDAAKQSLQQQAAKHMINAKKSRESVHKAVFMATLASMNDDLLSSLLETITPGPQPEELAEGLSMLNEDFGFNFTMTV